MTAPGTRGRGLTLTVLVNSVLYATGVSLRNMRRLTFLQTPDVDFLATSTKHRSKRDELWRRHAERTDGKMTVVITHDGTDNPEVYTDLRTLSFLVSEAIKGNEAHWARVSRAAKDTDEGEY